jgi:hypothetical protein
LPPANARPLALVDIALFSTASAGGGRPLRQPDELGLAAAALPSQQRVGVGGCG